MNKFPNDLISNKQSFYFVSPHLDDAVFSVGGLLCYLSSIKANITVINVFTSSGGVRDTLSSKTFLKQCKYSSARTLFDDRKKEDALVFKMLEKVKVINLDYIDALWRIRQHPHPILRRLDKFIPELTRVYPTYRFHINKGKVHKDDNILVSDLSNRLQRLVTPNSVILSPLGIGGHVDHLVVREAVRHISARHIHWADFPYYLREKAGDNFTNTNSLKLYSFTGDPQKKLELINGYQSQVLPVFGITGPPIKPDLLYV